MLEDFRKLTESHYTHGYKVHHRERVQIRKMHRAESRRSFIYGAWGAFHAWSWMCDNTNKVLSARKLTWACVSDFRWHCWLIDCPLVKVSVQQHLSPVVWVHIRWDSISYWHKLSGVVRGVRHKSRQKKIKPIPITPGFRGYLQEAQDQS